MTLNRAHIHNGHLTITPITSRHERYGPTFQYLRQQVLAEEHTCHICGQPPTPTDPLTVDHLNGTNTRATLKAAHRTCNSRRR